MKVGDRVRKIHVHDGTANAGQAVGPVLTIIEIGGQRCIDGVGGKDVIIVLSDGTWEFSWNLVQEKGGQSSEI